MRSPASPMVLETPESDYRTVVELDRRRQTIGLVALEQAVHLVGEQRDVTVAGDLDDALVVGPGRQRTRRVVREVHHDQPGAGPHELVEALGIEAPEAASSSGSQRPTSACSDSATEYND